MPLHFVDSTGREGRITADFAVEYEGPFDVEAYVRETASETRSTEEIVEELILGMVDDLGVEEVRREEPSPPLR